jgi:hypothetical protein
MADKTVALEASNLVNLGANFHVQDSGTRGMRDQSRISDAQGNIQCETMINARTEYNNTYDYCNATPDIKGDFGSLLTEFGNVQNSKVITELVINFNSGQYAGGTVQAHNHTDNAHAAGLSIGYADVSATIPASAGFGCPSFGLTLGTDATPVSATLTFRMNHIDREDADGAHWVGKNIAPEATLQLTTLGIPTSQTASAIETDLSGWTVDEFGPTDSNSDFDGYVITAHRTFDLAT